LFKNKNNNRNQFYDDADNEIIELTQKEIKYKKKNDLKKFRSNNILVFYNKYIKTNITNINFNKSCFWSKIRYFK
jgi:hypothetical protein